ncbi:MAG TPA: DUF4349 domain-containing protein [Candidatus Angelobacter sp.]|nr:DUF4349 domain-containing protein [Candidatus Angelobacter sp.]
MEPDELMAYLDGELGAKESSRAAAHLDQCEQCQKIAAELRDVSQFLAGWQTEPFEANLVESVSSLPPTTANSEIKNRNASLLDRTKWLRVIHPLHWPKTAWGIAAAGILIALVGVPTLHRSRQDAARAVPILPDPVKALPPVILDSNASRSREPEGLLSAPSRAPSVSKYSGDRLDDLQEKTQPNEAARTAPVGPMIVRTGELELIAHDFDQARPKVEEILKRHRGYMGELSLNTPPNSGRSLTATLRVPETALDAVLTELKGLGRTDKELQNGEDVTQRYVDLEARLSNAQNTKQRLADILRQRTGKLADVLAVEEEIDRVQGEIEEMEAQRKTMKKQIDFGTLKLTITEDYRSELKMVQPSTGAQIRNAAVEGYRNLSDGMIAILLWVLSAGPSLLVLGAVLFFPARMLWKKLRPNLA